MSRVAQFDIKTLDIETIDVGFVSREVALIRMKLGQTINLLVLQFDLFE